jgi:hypothetical protein
MGSNDTTGSAWTGWIAFAAMVLVIVGAIDVIQGFFAVIEDNYVVATGEGLAIVDVTGWGWFNIFWGALLVLAGLALLGGAGWARWLGIIGVGFGAVAQMGFLANYPQAYPLWNITILTLQIVVLFALVAKWGEYKASI